MYRNTMMIIEAQMIMIDWWWCTLDGYIVGALP